MIPIKFEISGDQVCNSDNFIIIFHLDEPKYALPLSIVERVVRAVEITRIPNAPAFIMGAINVQGNIIPVVNIRSRLHLPDCEIRPDDHFIIARTQKRNIVLVADQVIGIYVPEYDRTEHTDKNFPQVDYIKGVTRIGDNIIFIYDIDTFLSPEEERELDNALTAGTS